MSLTNSGYFAVIYLCLLSGDRTEGPVSQIIWGMGEKKTKQNTKTCVLLRRRIYHRLVISIISTGALTVNTRGSRFTLEKGEDKEWTELGLGQFPKGPCSNCGTGKFHSSVQPKLSFLRTNNGSWSLSECWKWLLFINQSSLASLSQLWNNISRNGKKQKNINSCAFTWIDTPWESYRKKYICV